MKFFDKLGKLEQGIGRTVGLSKGFGTFAKADVANRVRIMMDDESYVDGSGRTMAPNVYTLRFAPGGFPRLTLSVSHRLISLACASGATRSLLSCAIWRFRTPARRVTPSLVRFA